MGIRYLLAALAAICLVLGIWVEWRKPRWARESELGRGWFLLAIVLAWLALIAFYLHERGLFQ